MRKREGVERPRAMDLEFNEIVLHPADGTVFPQRFKILVSDGNDNWVEIANEQVALPVEKELKINIEKTKARYIKFVVPKLIRNKYGWVYELGEIEVFNK